VRREREREKRERRSEVQEQKEGWSAALGPLADCLSHNRSAALNCLPVEEKSVVCVCGIVLVLY